MDLARPGDSIDFFWARFSPLRGRQWKEELCRYEGGFTTAVTTMQGAASATLRTIAAWNGKKGPHFLAGAISGTDRLMKTLPERQTVKGIVFSRRAQFSPLSMLGGSVVCACNSGRGWPRITAKERHPPVFIALAVTA